MTTPENASPPLISGPNPAAPEITTDSRRTDTSYVILELVPTDPNGDPTDPPSISWDVVGKQDARNPEAAVLAYAEGKKLGDNGATFCAVPTRSWKPTRVKPKVVTTLEIEEA